MPIKTFTVSIVYVYTLYNPTNISQKIRLRHTVFYTIASKILLLFFLKSSCCSRLSITFKLFKTVEC